MTAIVIEYIILSLVKIFDNVVLTAKSIAVHKEKKILSSILVVISQLTFYLVISKVLKDNTLLAIIIVACSAGVGNLLAFFINDKFKKDVKWTYVLTTSNIADMQKLCTYLTVNKIKHIANGGYTREGEDTIHVIAFSKSKHDSRLINTFLEGTETKYMVEVI